MIGNNKAEVRTPLKKLNKMFVCEDTDNIKHAKSIAIDQHLGPDTSWLELTTSLYKCVADNYGQRRTFRQILFSDFAIEHEWFYKNGEWVNGYSNDLDKIAKIRNNKIDKGPAKQTLQCYTPSALYECKKKGSEKIVHYNPILQIDFDNIENAEQVKAEIFNLPFAALVSKSVSGNGVFALLLIGEPDKVREYAAHCFEAFKHFGLTPDITKGRNYSDLRFVSYDSTVLYREFPEPLKITNFYKAPVREFKPIYHSYSPNKLIERAIKEVAAALPGNRSNTVNKWCYILGGRNVGIDEIVDTINNTLQYAGEEALFINVAKSSFTAGQLKAIAL